jgi:hypothetical protein
MNLMHKPGHASNYKAQRFHNTWELEDLRSEGLLVSEYSQIAVILKNYASIPGQTVYLVVTALPAGSQCQLRGGEWCGG